LSLLLLFACKNTVTTSSSSTSQGTIASDPNCALIAKHAPSTTQLALADAETGKAADPFLTEALAALTQKIHNPTIQAVFEPSSYTSSPSHNRVHFTFQLARGTPLCPFSAQVFTYDSSLHISENITSTLPPGISAPEPSQLQLPDLGQSLQQLYTALNLSPTQAQQAQIFTQVQASSGPGFSANSCLTWINDSWQIAWNIEFRANPPLPGDEFSQPQTDSQVGSTLPNGMNLADSAKSIPQLYQGYATATQVIGIPRTKTFSLLTGIVNTTVISHTFPPTISIVPKTITNMSPGGTLCTPDFATAYDNGSERAYSASGNFAYLPAQEGIPLSQDPATTQIQQQEASFFANTQAHLAYFKTIGATDASITSQIQLLMVMGTDPNSANTACFVPATSTSPNAIMIGAGDGTSLYHLRESQEVPSHELGHYFIYKYLTQVVRGQPSSVIHEGLADAFVVLRTGDPCFGEGICPPSGAVCNSQQCLRNSDNPDLVFGAPNLPTEFHQVGQVISGMMWTIGKTIGNLVTAKLLYLAVTYLEPAADYQNLLVSLMMADKTLNGGTNACTIFKIALDYGFNLYIDSSLQCETYGPTSTSTTTQN